MKSRRDLHSHAVVTWLATLNLHPAANRLVDFWWIRIPLWGARRLSKPVGLLLTDGVYLSAWPAVAAVAPPLALLIGLLLGWLRFAPGDTFTWSIPVMAVMLVISSFGAGLGAWLWLGYVIGDFFLFTHPVSIYNHTSPVSAFNRTPLGEILLVRVPLLQTYILLAVLLVAIPLVGRELRRRINARWRQQPRQARTRITVALGAAALQATLVFLWTQVAPILNGPLYSWSRYGKYGDRAGGYLGPPLGAMHPLVTMGWVLVVLAALAGGVCVALQYVAAARPATLQTLKQLHEGLMRVPKPRAWTLPAWAEIIVPTGVATWMLAGLVDNVQEALGLVVVLACIRYARKYLIPRLAAYERLISRVPLTSRLIGGFAISFVLGQIIIGAMWKDPYMYTWLPMLISVTLTLIIIALLLPPAAAPRQNGTLATGAPSQASAHTGGHTQ